MKATPIAKYLEQKGRTEPVAWPPTRQDAFPLRPKQAQRGQETPTSVASEFRRATLSDAIQARARDASDRQSGAPADTRRRDSIFSRPREAAPAPESPPEPALDSPDSMSETLLIKSADGRDQFLEELLERKDKSPQRHLQKLVDFDEEHAAAILKQWIRQGANG